MTNRVIGPGIGLPAPQILYPASLYQIPYTQGANEVALAPGQSIQVPAGDWIIDLGKYSILEFQDPVQSPSINQTASVWRPIRSQRGTFPLRSDGINYRISNLTGCAVGGIVTNGGTGYVQASTTVTASTGNSTWYPIVGGALAQVSMTAFGAGYSIAPIVYIPAPPAPGIQATAVASLSGTSGTVASITITNQGAGYTTAPTITLLPNIFDVNTTNGTALTAATAVANLSFSGQLTGVLCTNPGAPVAVTATLTVAGAGTSALVSPVFLTTLSAMSVTALGSGTFTGAALSTIGGVPSATPAFTAFSGFIPRQAQVNISVSGGHAGALTVGDTGLFLGSVNPIVSLYGGSYADTSAANSIAFSITQGSANDVVIVQPA